MFSERGWGKSGKNYIRCILVNAGWGFISSVEFGSSFAQFQKSRTKAFNRIARNVGSRR